MDTTNSVILPPKYLQPIYMEDTSSDFQSSSFTADSKKRFGHLLRMNKTQ